MAKHVIIHPYARPKQKYNLPQCRYEFKNGKVVEKTQNAWVMLGG